MLDLLGHIAIEIVGHLLVYLGRGIRWLFRPVVRLLEWMVGERTVFELARWSAVLAGLGWLCAGFHVGMTDGRDLSQFFAVSSIFGGPVLLFCAWSMGSPRPSRV